MYDLYIVFSNICVPVSEPEGISVDSVSRMLFYTDQGIHTVNVMSLDDKHHIAIINELDEPTAIIAVPTLL